MLKSEKEWKFAHSLITLCCVALKFVVRLCADVDAIRIEFNLHKKAIKAFFPSTTFFFACSPPFAKVRAQQPSSFPIQTSNYDLQRYEVHLLVELPLVSEHFKCCDVDLFSMEILPLNTMPELVNTPG